MTTTIYMPRRLMHPPAPPPEPPRELFCRECGLFLLEDEHEVCAPCTSGATAALRRFLDGTGERT